MPLLIKSEERNKCLNFVITYFLFVISGFGTAITLHYNFKTIYYEYNNADT